MKNFPLFNTEQQNLVAEFYIWPAIFWGFPIEFIFSKTLADEIDVGYYGLRSSGFADIMALSDQYIVFGDKGPTTVGDFIRKFLSFNVGETEIDKSFQFEYVRTFVAEHILPDEYIVHLQRLLALFVNLRECDLFDYRGYLSDIDLMPMMDWELYFENEVNYKRVEEIKNYFTLVRRPLFHKIRIINAVENHEWREEKFLEKLIDLSDIFESAYDGMYGRLVYFDEIANQFELDKTLTDMVARLESMGKK